MQVRLHQMCVYVRVCKCVCVFLCMRVCEGMLWYIKKAPLPSLGYVFHGNFVYKPLLALESNFGRTGRGVIGGHVITELGIDRSTVCWYAWLFSCSMLLCVALLLLFAYSIGLPLSKKTSTRKEPRIKTFDKKRATHTNM